MREGQNRDYTFNLRRGFLKSPKWKRSKKAVSILRDLIKRHSKIENVRLGKWVNEHIWKHGGKNPPGKVKINIKVEKHKNEKTKAETLIAHAELAELPPKALRLIKLEEEKKKKAVAKKKEEIPKKIEETKEKITEIKKKVSKKKEDRKASKKELQKELAEAKAEEKEKKQAKVTASMERKMHK